MYVLLLLRCSEPGNAGGRNSGPQVSLEEITIDLLEARYRVVSQDFVWRSASTAAGRASKMLTLAYTPGCSLKEESRCRSRRRQVVEM